jgi:hypothetical protein
VSGGRRQIPPDSSKVNLQHCQSLNKIVVQLTGNAPTLILMKRQQTASRMGISLGTIPQDLPISDNVARFIIDPGEYTFTPEPAPILPYMPSLIFRSPGPAGRIEFQLHVAVCDVLRGEEHASRLPQDFVSLVTENALRPGVPARDAIVRIERDEGVVANGIDEYSELPI